METLAKTHSRGPLFCHKIFFDPTLCLFCCQKWYHCIHRAIRISPHLKAQSMSCGEHLEFAGRFNLGISITACVTLWASQLILYDGFGSCFLHSYNAIVSVEKVLQIYIFRNNPVHFNQLCFFKASLKAGHGHPFAAHARNRTCVGRKCSRFTVLWADASNFFRRICCYGPSSQTMWFTSIQISQILPCQSLRRI